eukprot:PhF_6_TR40713/c0_g1_i2/m.61221
MRRTFTSHFMHSAKPKSSYEFLRPMAKFTTAGLITGMWGITSVFADDHHHHHHDDDHQRTPSPTATLRNELHESFTNIANTKEFITRNFDFAAYLKNFLLVWVLFIACGAIGGVAMNAANVGIRTGFLWISLGFLLTARYLPGEFKPLKVVWGEMSQEDKDLVVDTALCSLMAEALAVHNVRLVRKRRFLDHCRRLIY